MNSRAHIMKTIMNNGILRSGYSTNNAMKWSTIVGQLAVITNAGINIVEVNRIMPHMLTFLFGWIRR